MRCADTRAGLYSIERRSATRTLAFALVLVATAPQGAEPPVVGLGWLRDLAGHCWRGEPADGAPADTQCYELQFDRHLRGTIEIAGAAGEAPKLRGDSVWSWDAAKQKITVVTWSSSAPVGVIEAAVDGDLVRFTFGPNARSYWQRTGPDSFAVVRERREGEAWREERRVSYRRAPGR
jgi:hypothetical protein